MTSDKNSSRLSDNTSTSLTQKTCLQYFERQQATGCGTYCSKQRTLLGDMIEFGRFHIMKVKLGIT